MKRGTLFSLVCLPLLLGLGLVIAWLAFPMPAAAQPAQPEDTLFWSEDFSAPFSPASYYITATPGSGVVMSDTFLLTQNTGGQRGRIFYLTPTLMDVFSATFSINLGTDADGGGADGLAFHFCPVYDYPPDTGGFLDATCPGGYLVAFDTYPGSEVYLAQGGSGNRLVQVNTGSLEDNAWHAAEVRLEAGLVTVVLDSATLIDHYVIPNYTPFMGYFGFSAATGGEYNAQSVDTIQVSTGASGSLEGHVYDEMTALPIAGATVSSGWFQAQTDVNGYYTLLLPSGIYTVTAAHPSYVPESVVGIEIITGTVVQDFDLLKAISVIPSPIEITMTYGTVDSIGALVENSLSQPYTFTFREVKSYGLMDVDANDILLMGDDVAAADWQTYRDALTYAGVTWDEWNIDTTPFPTLVELTPYTVLIWMDESSLAQTDAQCQIVVDWLNLGGKALFATSIDFLWDIENGAVGAGEHNLYLMFQTAFQGDYAGATIAALDGVPGNPIGDDFAPPNSIGLAGTADSSGDYANVATSAATTALIYGTGGAGSGYSAMTYYEGANYKIAWLGVNFHNGLTDQGERNALMANVLGFLYESNVPWFGTSIPDGVVPASGSLAWTNYFTATSAVGVDQPGEYRMKLILAGDPREDVPVVMTVLPAADMGLLSGTVLDNCTGDAIEASITITGGLPVTQTGSDPDSGYYSAWLVEGTYDVQFIAPGHLPYTTTVTILAGGTTNLDVDLPIDGPCMTVDPTSLSAEMCPDTITMQPLQVCNLGGSLPLDWNLLQGSLEFTVGGTNNPFTGGARDRGNIFEITQTRQLNEIRVYLNISAVTDIYFIVYEGNAMIGVYTQTHQNQVFDLGPGEGWYSSGPINVILEAGKFYYIAASWNASATYYRSNDATPFVVPSFGILHTGVAASRSGYPPAATINNTYGSGMYSPYYFQLVTGSAADVPWLSVEPISGSVGMDTCQEITVTFDSTGLGWGDYYNSLWVVGNAANASGLIVPLTMTALQPMEILSVTYLTDALSVAFTPSITGSPPIDYLWDFGDGITSTESNPIHTYAASGYYTATLLASNACAVDTWSGVIWVCDPVHDAGFAWSPPTPIAGETAYFTATASGTGPFTFEWDFGDGITDTGQYVGHAFATEGTYTITLTVTGECGMAMVTHEVVVAAACVAPAGADFSWTPLTPLVDAAVAFTGTLATGTGPLAWEWDFGDGITDTGQYASHAFTASGTYTVTLTVRNGCGEVSVSYEIIIEQPFTRIYLPMLKKN